MIHRVDGLLRDEADRFRLVFACPGCVHFDPDARRCSLGYPSGVHEESSLEGRDEVVFCKHFELW
jgi:hypothetical protein